MMPDQIQLAGGRLKLALGKGNTYHVRASSREASRALLDELTRLPSTAAVTGDGGLLEELCVGENLALPLQYRNDPRQGEWMLGAHSWFAACGLDPESCRSLLDRRPGTLNPFERRMAGFVRAMLQEPEILVLDSLHDGLTEAEDRRVARFEAVFHQRYPFRTVVHLELDREWRQAPTEGTCHV